MKYVDVRDLPPCSFSPQCLRLIDDLDMPTVASMPRRLAYIEDLQDERQLRKLRSHLANCPTCSALLAEARRTRTQQRLMLYHFLVRNEQQVPSTSSAIIEALRREKMRNEQRTAQRGRVTQNLTLCEAPAEQGKTSDPSLSPVPSHARLFQHRSLFQNVLTLATVAAVILAAVGLLNHFSDQPASAPSSQTPHPTQRGRVANSYGWNDVLIGLTMLSAAGVVKGFSFYNYNAPDGQLRQLFSSEREYAEIDLEGISQDGQSLLYDESSTDQQRAYTTYSPATGARQVYQLGADRAGNAIWMDAEHVLVQNTSGRVMKLDARTGLPQQTWLIQTGKLAFYHQPFLYFLGAQNAAMDALYRVSLAEAGATPQQITKAASGTRFWLSPDGTTVFYANNGGSGTQGIYAVDSDGAHPRLLRAGPGIPIGYADDNALMLLQEVDRRIEVIQLGATPTQPERVVFANAAPGATSLCGPDRLVALVEICDRKIALQPDGHGLLLDAYYANGSHSLVYDDLATGSSRTILTLPATTTVQLPGWSKMSATPSAFDDQSAALCAA